MVSWVISIVAALALIWMVGLSYYVGYYFGVRKVEKYIEKKKEEIDEETKRVLRNWNI
jgi:membrane protein DedA with SNARE-associated domain